MTNVKDTATGNIQYNSYGYDADNNVHTITDNVTPANNQTLTYNRIDAPDLRDRQSTARSAASPTTSTATA